VDKIEDKRIKKALSLARQYSQIDGDHHKAWVIDQMVLALLGTQKRYDAFVKDYKAGDDGPDTYDWNVGIAP